MFRERFNGRVLERHGGGKRMAERLVQARAKLHKTQRIQSGRKESLVARNRNAAIARQQLVDQTLDELNDQGAAVAGRRLLEANGERRGNGIELRHNARRQEVAESSSSRNAAAAMH